MTDLECRVEGCELKVKSRHLCAAHYTAHRSGRPLEPLRPWVGRRATAITRNVSYEDVYQILITDNIQIPEPYRAGECHLWTGKRYSVHHDRPAKTTLLGRLPRSMYPQELIWDTNFPGERRNGFFVHMRCLNYMCCNPGHMYVVDVKDRRTAKRYMPELVNDEVLASRRVVVSNHES